MKTFVFFVAILVAGASAGAVPTLDAFKQAVTDVDSNQGERFIDAILENILASVSQQIKDAGLDPLDINEIGTSFALSQPSVFSAKLWARHIRSTGLSNIVINSIDFSVIFLRLRFDVSLPRITVAVGDSGAEVVLLSNDLNTYLSGGLQIVEPRVSGEVRVSLLPSVSINSMSLDLSLGGIYSNLYVNVLGRDISNPINQLLSEKLPADLATYSSEINQLISSLALSIINSIL